MALNFASGSTSVSLEQLCRYELNRSHLILVQPKVNFGLKAPWEKCILVCVVSKHFIAL